jgi:tetratricopeptide (TPR) repeat protein
VQSAIESAGESALTKPDFFVMGSECAWQLKDHNRALMILADAQARFPDKRAFGRQRIQRLLSLGLYQSAAEIGRDFVDNEQANQDDVLFLAEALLKAKQADAAVLVLEKSRLQYPADNRMRAQSAHAWLAKGYPRTAARQFLDAAITEEKYARDAAEVYRELGLPHQALLANARILDQDLKLRQRLAILIDMERFEAVTALEPRLSRLELLKKDEELRYALAYAFYRVGIYGGAERHLRSITKPALFTRAANLRKAMADCRNNVSSCD